MFQRMNAYSASAEKTRQMQPQTQNSSAVSWRALGIFSLKQEIKIRMTKDLNIIKTCTYAIIDLRDIVKHVDEHEDERDKEDNPGSDDVDGDDEADPGHDGEDPGRKVDVQQIGSHDPSQVNLQRIHGIVT